MKKINLLFYFILVPAILSAQKITINKIEPGNWWTGMKLNKIQLMVYGKNLEGASAKFNTPEIKVEKVHKIANHAYAFIDITISKNISPRDYELVLSKGSEKTAFKFPILKKEKDKNRFQGFSDKDVIYLIMPDRFDNGDVANDSVAGYSDYMNKIPGQGRAGGDIQGMIDRLDYIKDLGFTTIWSTPVTENNTFRSYHGYASTNFYKVDPRLGSNELYKTFVEDAHKKGLKVILDHVSNHCSDDHPWIKNLPMNDWLNGSVEHHLNADHNKMEFTDPYADSSTIKHIEQGWFVSSMPDLNGANPFVENYIIENTIWWVEYSGVDGIREDTYPYNNQKFMARWAKTILNEYPTLNIVGEVWSGEPSILAGYQKDTFLPRKFNTNLPAITDFALRDVFTKYLQEKGSLFDVFNLLAKDYLYKNPNDLVTFADNHDMPRVMHFANGNFDRAKIVYTLLLTTRGIPEIFYGSEIGLVGTTNDGGLRVPFPGGFPHDTRNAFTKEGRTPDENNIFDFLRELIHIRDKYPALSQGKLVHFPPAKDIYFYFRTLGQEKMLVVINGSKNSNLADLSVAKDLISAHSNLTNVKTGMTKKLDAKMQLEAAPMSAEIYEIAE